MLRGLRRWGEGFLSTARDYWLVADGDERLLWARATALVTAAAFWLAIPLPFVYIPVLAYGVDSRTEGLVLLALIGLHVLALGLGRPYATRRFSEK